MYYLEQTGEPVFSEDWAVNVIYHDSLESLDNAKLVNSLELRKFNKHCQELDIKSLSVNNELLESDTQDYDNDNQIYWLMPDSYKSLDIESFLLNICDTAEEKLRIQEELVAFKEKNLICLLQYMKFLVDTMKDNKILWGVGRGSSVASFVLYKIGVHRINPLKYNLDWQSFLR